MNVAAAADYLAAAGLTPTQITRLACVGYYTAPASRSHHLAHAGGLAEHSANVTARLVQLTAAFAIPWSRDQSPYLVGMLHDLVKCRCYAPAAIDAWEYVQPCYPGHGAASVAIAAELGIRLCRDEIVAIAYHMGHFGVGKEYSAEEFQAAVSQFGPQVIATHVCDWFATKVDEAKEVKTK